MAPSTPIPRITENGQPFSDTAHAALGGSGRLGYAELGAFGVASEVDRVQHPRLVAAQAEGVRGPEQHCVAESRQPALAAPAADLADLVEERLQLLPVKARLLGSASASSTWAVFHACTTSTG